MEVTQCSVSTVSSQKLLLLLPLPKDSPSPPASAPPTFPHAGPPCRRRRSVPSPCLCATHAPLPPAGGTQLGRGRAGAGVGPQEGRRCRGERGEATDRKKRRYLHVHHLLCAPPRPPHSDHSRVPAAPPVSTGRPQEAPRPCSSSPPPPSPPPTCRSPPSFISSSPPPPRHPPPAGGGACRPPAAQQVTAN